ncbi:hypothetical protein H3C61_03675 [Candidatus Gracilibacteria bacterium]|nr:hypothetical protein [Candidatus Gracilibacteria bacterium]
MIATEGYKINNKSYNMMRITIFVFLFSIILTILLFFYNKSLSGDIDNINLETTKISENIKKINEDKKVKLYTLVTTNKTYLDKYKYLSNIPLFLNTLLELSSKSKIAFNGFSYNEGSISTNATSIDDGYSYASSKVKNFVKDFRKGENGIFSLDFITSFNGQQEIDFGLKFKVK